MEDNRKGRRRQEGKGETTREKDNQYEKDEKHQKQPAEKRRKLGKNKLEVSAEGNKTWRQEKV